MTIPDHGDSLSIAIGSPHREGKSRFGMTLIRRLRVQRIGRDARIIALASDHVTGRKYRRPKRT